MKKVSKTRNPYAYIVTRLKRKIKGNKKKFAILDETKKEGNNALLFE